MKFPTNYPLLIPCKCVGNCAMISYTNWEMLL